MAIQEKLAKLKSEMKLRAASFAVKLATVATLFGGTAAVSSCTEQNKDTDEKKDKIENVEKSKTIENVEGSKTSVVFRAKKQDRRGHSLNYILMENGDELDLGYVLEESEGLYLEPGDTVTYEGKDIKAVRYKDGYGKRVNFGEIGKIQKDRGR